MAKPLRTAETIVDALNLTYHTHIVISKSKFFGAEGRPIIMYIVKDCYKEKSGHFQDDELFRSTSAIYICFFMRDLLYSMQGKEIPPDSDEGVGIGWQEQKKRKNPQVAIDFIKEKYLDAHKLPHED